jgi:hypothetical protein
MSDYESIQKHHLRVSSYDRVSSWLVSALVVAGVAVAALVFIYFTRQLLLEGDFAVPVTPVSAGGGGTGGSSDPTGTGQDLEPPGIEEAPDLTEPQLQDTLSAVATAVTSRSALIADETIDANMEPVAGTGAGDSRRPGGGGGAGGGYGGGIGAGFGRGRGGPPEPQREIRFEPQSIGEYAQWLDFYKIELAVIDTQNNKVYYAYNLSRAKPDVRVSDPSQQPEQRFNFNSSLSHFAALDRQLAAKAGIADKGDIIFQFLPDQTAAILFDLERKSAGGRKPEQIRRTVFRVTRNGNRFEFSVAEQSYR